MSRRKDRRTFKWNVDILQNFDIILVVGRGPWATMVRANTLSPNEAFDKGVLTHIAIVYELPSGEKCLVEARGGKGVQIRPLTDYDHHNAFRYACGVRRLTLTDTQKTFAQKFLDVAIARGAEYDGRGMLSFNRMVDKIRTKRGKKIQDADKYYCSELARGAFITALPIEMQTGLIPPEAFKDVNYGLTNWKL